MLCRGQEHRRQATCSIIDPRPRNNNILSGHSSTMRLGSPTLYRPVLKTRHRKQLSFARLIVQLNLFPPALPIERSLRRCSADLDGFNSWFIYIFIYPSPPARVSLIYGQSQIFCWKNNKDDVIVYNELVNETMILIENKLSRCCYIGKLSWCMIV